MLAPLLCGGQPVALLIGEGEQSRSHLTSIESTLQQQGWLVTSQQDRDLKQLRDGVTTFARSAPTQSIALVYICGQFAAGEYKSREQQVPVSAYFRPHAAEIRNPNDIRGRCLSVHELVERLTAEAGSTRYVVLLHQITEADDSPAESIEPIPDALVAFSQRSNWTTSLAKQLAANLDLWQAIEQSKPTWVSSSSDDPLLLDHHGAAWLSVETIGGNKAGQEIVNSFGQTFCWCPPGKFIMGSPSSEQGRSYDEDQVDVTISQGFWISKYEITEREYKLIRGRSQREPVGKNYPVVDMRSGDARNVAEQLTKLEHQSGRLPRDWVYDAPTEAQWEYACRAGSPAAYSFGGESKQIGRFANCADQTLWEYNESDYRYADRQLNDGHALAAPVGSYLPNAWGIHDMHGNVWEWCQDAYQVDLAGGVDPRGPDKGTDRGRVIRGGSWLSRSSYCRSAMRQAHHDLNSASYIGIRLVIRRKGD